jgi:Icc-related predicted phosphoesterase
MPDDALKRHEASLAWLEKKLAQTFAGITVVVTHHAPIPEGVGPQFQGDVLSPGFASDLKPLIRKYAPQIWVHGHTHHNHCTRIGKTRVCSYQWGYPGEGMETSVGLFEITSD